MASDALRFLDLESPGAKWMTCDILNKGKGVYDYIQYMLDRTNKMFQWTGLPDTIPPRILELFLQINGYAAFVEIKETKVIEFPVKRKFTPGVYVFWGGIGGERDIYYRPSVFTLANPRLKQSIICPIVYDENDLDSSYENPAVVMKCDSNYMGLLPLFSRYASQMVENDISIRSAQINARAQVGISVNNDNEAETARKYLDNLEAGKLAVIGQSAFLEGISVANVGTQSANVIIQLIELQQYLKASWFNDLGLNANFNMKREYISREEIGSQTDVLLPLVDDMLECREEACKLINSLFGLNVSVQKNSAWADKDQTILNSLGAGAVEGNMPLIGDVADRLEAEAGVQLAGDPEAVAGGGIQDAGEDESEGEVQSTGSDSELSEVVREAAAEAVSMIVEKLEGGEGGEVDESEAPEKSEESGGE